MKDTLGQMLFWWSLFQAESISENDCYHPVFTILHYAIVEPGIGITHTEELNMEQSSFRCQSALRGNSMDLRFPIGLLTTYC